VKLGPRRPLRRPRGPNSVTHCLGYAIYSSGAAAAARRCCSINGTADEPYHSLRRGSGLNRTAHVASADVALGYKREAGGFRPVGTRLREGNLSLESVACQSEGVSRRVWSRLLS
jgi:hypothetical protein